MVSTPGAQMRCGIRERDHICRVIRFTARGGRE